MCFYEIQRRQDHSNTRSHSKIFNHRRDEKTVSGFLVDPTKQSCAVNDAREDSGDDLSRRASLSGPLVQGSGRRRVGRECNNDPLAASTRANLSKLSGLVAARTASSDDQQENPGPSQPESMNNLGRFRGSINEVESARMQDRKHRSQKIVYSRPQDDGKTCTKESALVSIIFLGPNL